MTAFGISLAITVLVVGVAAYYFGVYFRRNYFDAVTRIFQEKPLFICPKGKAELGSEDIWFPGPDGLTLRGCYLRGSRPRRGVIFFGIEFGSNRWSALHYCTKLREAGYDVFAFEMRNQGESDCQPGYEPLHWVTDRDLADVRAALAYLKGRADADPRGIGLFGISKGGSAGLIAAADDPAVRCCVTDGAYATMGTMIPFMKHFMGIYSPWPWIPKIVPNLLFVIVGQLARWKVAAERGVSYPNLEPALKRLRRPLFMIHGQRDSYIKPAMAEALFALAAEPKQLWVIEKAKHNQGLQIAGTEYHRRVVEFFEQHLGDLTSLPDGRTLPLEASPTSMPTLTPEPIRVPIMSHAAS